jgi:hypothetical protein
MKSNRLTEIYLKEMYSKVRISKYLSDNFPVQNGLKQGDALSSLLFRFTLVLPLGSCRESAAGLCW